MASTTKADAAKGARCNPFGEVGAETKEFEREPVPEGARKGWLSFLAVFAGRHTAGTEFSIGPLFIIHGASAVDVLVGVFLGNFLAVLTWRFLVAPIAVRKRYTTYYLLERICGRWVLPPYLLFVGIILSVLAGAMFTVSATAIGVLFDVPMPGLNDWLPSSWAFCACVLAVGIVTATVAAFGYSYVTTFSKLMTPYMFAVIAYMCVESLRELDVTSFGSFMRVASQKVWTGHAEDGFSHFGFWHCLFTAWFCDLMLHIGMLDLTIMRYATQASIGWSSAAGMYPGHYFTWITAAFLYAVQLSKDPDDKAVAPGPMANAVAGANGLLCVVLAGWSTANPAMYEAGLSFQALLGPGWGTRRVTFVVGALATLAGCFPALVMRILELLAFGGLVVMPMGMVIIADCFLLPALGLEDEYSEREKARIRESSLDARGPGAAGDVPDSVTNWPAVAAWLVTNAVMLPLAATDFLAVFFAPLAGMPLALAIYLGGAYFRERCQTAPSGPPACPLERGDGNGCPAASDSCVQ